jgi:bacillolysin
LFADGTFVMEVNVTTNALDGWSCPNAMFYNGRSYYCPGMGYGADVAGHEWGHGYSDAGESHTALISFRYLLNTSVVGSYGLVYQYQSGALSESFADIIGETVQLLWQQPQEYAPRANRSCTLPSGNRRWIIGDQITNVAPVLNADGKVYGTFIHEGAVY